MRKKRIKKLIGVIILVLGIGLGIYLGLNKFYFKKEKVETLEKEKLAIVKNNSFSDYTYIDSFRNYFIVNKNGLVGIIDNKGNVKVDFIYANDSFVIPGKDALIIGSLPKYYLYNQDLKLVATFDDTINLINDPVTKKDYYYTNDTLYDLDQNIVLKNINDYIDSGTWLEKIGNYVFIDSTIINLETKEKYIIDYFIKKDNYIYGINEEENKIYYMEYNEDLNTYEIETKVTNGFILKDKANNTYFFTLNHGLIKKESNREVNDYKFSYETCSYGFKVYNQNKLITDECYDDYYFNNDSKIISLVKDEFYYILNKDKIIKDEEEAIGVGNYLKYYNYETDSLIIKNLNGNIVDNNCSVNLDYRDAKTYVCENLDYSFLVDDKLKPISEYYDMLECISNTSYCIFKKDDKYGLLDDNKVLLEASYQMLEHKDNYIIASFLWGFDVYNLEKTSFDQEKLDVIIPNPYNNLNVLDIINKYNLNYMENLIKDNEELFKKYAYIVDNNANLGQYKNKVMNLFYEVVQNKDLMNEEIFLASLKKLKIEKKDVLGENNPDGLYYDNYKRIELRVDNDLVIYHELNHFLDYSLNKINNEVYKCNDKYISYQEYQNLKKEEKNNCKFVFNNDVNFLVEGGAEYYAGFYFNQFAVHTYHLQTSLIGALSYIYGFDYIKDIYLDSKEGIVKLFNLFIDAGVSENDINHFLDYSSSFHLYKEKDCLFITDTLIKLYESVFKKDWTEDLEFREIISMILGYIKIDKSYTNNYDEYLKVIDINFMDKYINKYKKIVPDIANNITFFPGFYYKTNDASYLILSFYDNHDVAYEILKFDFEKEIILERKTVKFV